MLLAYGKRYSFAAKRACSVFPHESSIPDGEIWKSWRSLFFNYIVISVGTQEYIEYWQVSALPSEEVGDVHALLNSWQLILKPPEVHQGRQPVLGPVGQGLRGLVTCGNSPVRAAGEIESLVALQHLHGLSWGNSFAPIQALKLDSSVHRTYMVSSKQKQKVI